MPGTLRRSPQSKSESETRRYAGEVCGAAQATVAIHSTCCSEEAQQFSLHVMFHRQCSAFKIRRSSESTLKRPFFRKPITVIMPARSAVAAAGLEEAPPAARIGTP